MDRKLKQIIIVFAYVVLFSGAAYLVFKLVSHPTCTDEKKNGNEQGIDCGGPCLKQCVDNPELEAIQIGVPSLLNDNGRYDAAIEIRNPNSDYGFYSVSYKVTLFKGSAAIAERKGITYILPDEQRYVLELGMEAKEVPDRAVMAIENYKTRAFRDIEKPKFEIINKNHRYARVPGSFFETTFQVANRSNYNVNRVDLDVVLRDYSGKIIAINKGNINALHSGDIRDFRSFWPKEFRGEVRDVDVRAEADVMDLDNLITLSSPK